MMGNPRWRISIVLAGVVALSVLTPAHGVAGQGGTGAAAAQTPPGGRQNRPAPGPARPAIDAAKLRDVQDALDGLEFSRADRFLALSDAQFARFIPLLKRLQNLRRDQVTQRNRLVMELRRMTNPQAAFEDAQIEAQTKRLDAFERDAVQHLLAAYTAIDEVLDPKQRGRFRVFQEEMERVKLELLTRVLRNEPGPADRPARGGGGGGH